MKREFKTPFVPLIPILGIVVCLSMIYGLGWTNWLRLLLWLAIGLVIYFFYGKKHSKLNNPEE
jgi:APA family basic amino acid/polyamine antiporter